MSPKGACSDCSSRVMGGTHFHFGRRRPSHRRPPTVTRQGQCHHALRSEGPRRPTQTAFKKKANTMTTNFPKNVTRHRASDLTMTMPLGATFKKRAKPNRFVRASGCSSAWQVCCTTHPAGDPPRGRHGAGHLRPRLTWQVRRSGWAPLELGTRSWPFGIFTRSRICHTTGTTPKHPLTLLSRICDCQSQPPKCPSMFLQEPLEGFLRRSRKVCLAGKACLPALKISATIIKYSLPGKLLGVWDADAVS